MLQKPTVSPILMTIEEVSSLLKVPVKTIRQWVYQQKIPNIKLNGHVRFQLHKIDAWIQQSVR